MMKGIVKNRIQIKTQELQQKIFQEDIKNVNFLMYLSRTSMQNNKPLYSLVTFIEFISSIKKYFFFIINVIGKNSDKKTSLL